MVTVYFRKLATVDTNDKSTTIRTPVIESVEFSMAQRLLQAALRLENIDHSVSLRMVYSKRCSLNRGRRVDRSFTKVIICCVNTTIRFTGYGCF